VRQGGICLAASAYRLSAGFQAGDLNVTGSALWRPAIRVLLVEDDEDIAARLTTGLRPAGFVVDRAKNGEDGHAMGADDQFDAVILDLGLPNMEGLTVLRKWRAENRDMPVLILTARGTWTEKVEGLNAGADDYITKPFHIPEVVARLRALIRRKSGVATPLLTHKDISLDTVSGKATVGGKAVELTALELRMLSYFMHRIGRVISQNELMEHLYALEESAESNTIEVYISRLRRKLGRDVITTVRGLGYRMD
jgi:two-component system, OmpR family, response regulator